MVVANGNGNTPAAAAASTAVVTNGIRLTAVADKLSSHFHGSLSLNTMELFQLCYALASNERNLGFIVQKLVHHFRGSAPLSTGELIKCYYLFSWGIDYALSSNDMPRVANSIPVLVRKAFQHRNDPALNSAMMVLMISAKNACRSGWFTLDDRDEIVSMANEISSSFCLSMGRHEDPVETVSTLMKIMPKYFPQMNICRIITSFTAKAGYEIKMDDFFIQRNIATNEKIRLFVIQTDDLESSSCTTTPPLVSFLVNGKGVDKRNNVSMETGPQLPTDITKMLKYGTNIIQVVGYFNGNYLIAIAFTSKLDMVNPPILQDYVEVANDELDSDADIIMDSSTVSMNCPISFGRIKTPVKGHQCRHHQCFDYDNYMEINSRKPVWRCPCCNSSVFCLDLRLDQRMVQILKEVDETITSVTISSDGSWKKNEDQIKNSNKNQQNTINNTKQVEKQGSDADAVMHDVSADVASDVIDLTTGTEGNNNGKNGLIEVEDDTKPFLDCEVLVSVPHLNTVAPAQASGFLAAEENAWLRRTFSPGSGSLDSIIPDSILNPLAPNIANSIINNSFSNYISNNNNMSSVSTSGPQIGTSGRLLIPRNSTRAPNTTQALPLSSSNPNPSSFSSGRIIANGGSSSFTASQFSPGNASSSFMTPHSHIQVPNRTYQHTMSSLAQRPAHLRNSNSSSPLNPNPSSLLNPNSSGTRVPPIQIPSSGQRTFSQSPSPTARVGASETVRPELPPEQGWRPAGRMRGSLTGEAYASALSHYLQNPSPSSNPSPNSNRVSPN